MRRVARRRLQRLDDHLLDLVVADRPRPTRTRLVEQPVESALGKARPPRHRHVARDPESLSDLGVLEALGREQHDPRALRERLRARSAACGLLPGCVLTASV
jgi:hypothetical protein